MIHGQIKPLFNTPINWGHPLAQGLVASYLMNEGMGDLVHDSYGMNDGRTSGMAPMAGTSGWVPGPHGAALAFPGASGYVDCGPLLNINGISQLTILIWMQRGSVNAKVGFISYASGTNTIGVYLWSDGKIYFDIRNGSSSYGTAANASVGMQCAAMVFNGDLSGNARNLGYINGLPILLSYTGTAPATVPNGLANFLIGKISTSYSSGLISSVSIYNRALSANEIAYLYAFPWCMYDRPASAWEYNQQNRNFDHYYRRLMAA
jgi:hypothetical protein